MDVDLSQTTNEGKLFIWHVTPGSDEGDGCNDKDEKAIGFLDQNLHIVITQPGDWEVQVASKFDILG